MGMLEKTIIQESIGLIDEVMNRQLNRVLHHSAFQQLEAGWRGLTMLVSQVKKNQRTKVRYLSLSLKELAKDLSNAAEFEQALLFQKIYSNELDSPGGEPFGLLLGDYYVSHSRNKIDAIDVLERMSQICAAAFVPFVTGVHPNFFELDSFSELQPTMNLERLLSSDTYHRFHRLRKSENAHFLGLVFPRFIIREPYNANGISFQQRRFKESVNCHDNYLWGNAVYAYGSVAITAFEQTGWFMNMRGASQNESASSLLNLPRVAYASTKMDMVKLTTECLVMDAQEKRFNDLGFIALKDHLLSERAVFYSSQSVKLPKRTRNERDDASAKINSMLHYVLCASRIAHYIKVIIRDKIGSFTNVQACETYLTHWLSRYCSSAKGQSLASIMKNPLTRADVSVSELVDSPGKYYCAMTISPHSQFDDMQSQLRLTTNIKLK